MRRAAAVVLHWEQRRHLETLAESRATSPRVARRARIILRAAAHAENRTIAEELGIDPATVALWRRRFLSMGVAGLVRDAPRSGRPSEITEAAVQTVLRVTRHEPPPRGRRWSSRSLAKQVGLSKSTVQRIWLSHGVRGRPVPEPARPGAEMDFLERVTDLVGLYMHHPERAVAFATDERMPVGRSGSGSTPRARAPVTRNRGAEFRAFLQLTDRETPRTLDVHLLADSRLLPVPVEVSRWLARHPRFHLHFLPADRVGGTLIDRLIDGFSQRKDRPGASASAHRLKYALREHLRTNRDLRRPFVWTAASWEVRGAYGRRPIDGEISEPYRSGGPSRANPGSPAHRSGEETDRTRRTAR